MLSLVVLLSAASVAQTAPGEAAKLLPEQLGAFRAQSAPVRPSKGIFETARQEDYEVTSDALRVYTSADGKSFGVHLARASSESAAYSLFTHRVGFTRPSAVKLGEVGTVSASTPKEILFARGRAFVAVSDMSQGAADPQASDRFRAPVRRDA